jgi:hypothetical protein
LAPRRFYDGFIDLNDLTGAAKGRKGAGLHCFTNSMAKKPSSFHAARKHPLNLAGRNALLASAHKMDDLQPKMQWQVRRLENSTHAHSEGFPALIALAQAEPGSFASQLMNASGVSVPAVRANRAVMPKPCFYIGKGGIFILEVRGIEN